MVTYVRGHLLLSVACHMTSTIQLTDDSASRGALLQEIDHHVRQHVITFDTIAGMRVCVHSGDIPQWVSAVWLCELCSSCLALSVCVLVCVCVCTRTCAPPGHCSVC